MLQNIRADKPFSLFISIFAKTYIKSNYEAMEVFPINKETEQLFKEVCQRIFRLQNGRSLDSMERIGADTRGQIGASYLSLKNLAGQYRHDLKLAQLLWGTKKREEQIVACFIFPVQELITEKITQLIRYSYNFEIAEYFGTLVLAQREDLEQLVDEYLHSDDPFLQTAALTAIGKSRINRKANSPFTDCYIRQIDKNKFTEKYVQKVYDRTSISLEDKGK